MNTSEFARSRNIEPQAVTRYINRHPELFSGHTKKAGKAVFLDDIALELLDKKYPLPKLIEVVEDIQTIKELAEANRKIAELEHSIREREVKLAQLSAVQFLLEEKTERLAIAEKDLKSTQTELSNFKVECAELKLKNDMQEQELNSYKKTVFGLYKKEK